MPYTSGSPAIYYETCGDKNAEPLVLIEGHTAQLIGWREEFVARLVTQGFFVIRLDNRGVGLSSKIDDREFELTDMAGDVLRTLDALGLKSAHIVGQSMGGMIAQLLAIHHRERVRSLVLVYTIPALRDEYVTDAIKAVLAAPAPGPAQLTRETYIERFAERERLSGSTLYAFDETWIREYAARCFDRGHNQAGLDRQTAAVLRAGDRSEDLRKLDVPTAILHGRVDASLRVEAAFDLANLIPDSELHVYAGLGHEVARPLWDEFVSIIARTARRG